MMPSMQAQSNALPLMRIVLKSSKDELTQQIQWLLESFEKQPMPLNVILDMAKVRSLTVTQLSQLLLLAKKLAISGGQLLSQHMQGECSRLMQLLRVNLLIPEFVAGDSNESETLLLPVAA